MFGLGTKPPSAKDVTLRALALREIVAHAMSMHAPDARKAFREKWPKEEWAKHVRDVSAQSAPRFKDIGRLGAKLSPWEERFSVTTLDPVTDQQQIEASWRVESLRIMLWALGVEQELLAHDQSQDHGLIKTWPDGDFIRFRSKAKLRDRAEIEKARGVAELWHWRSRTRKLAEQGFAPTSIPGSSDMPTLDGIARHAAKTAHEHGDIPQPVEGDFPFMGKAYRDLDRNEYSFATSLAMERHYALNWLCGSAPGNRWDETPTDT
jgi:uncharacterized protein DUF4272